MTKFLRCAAPAAGAVFLTATAASADLTAIEVWADWQLQAEEAGLSLSAGAEDATADGLVLRDVSMTLDFPEGSMNGTIAEVTLAERIDGTVEIVMSPEFPMDFTVEPAEGGTGSFSMIISMPGATTVASGDDRSVSYATVAPLMSVAVDTVTAEGEEIPMAFDITMTSMTGTYSLVGEAPRVIESVFNAASMTMNLKGEDPEGGTGSVDMTATVQDLASTSKGTMSSLAGMSNLSEMLGAGLTSEGEVTHGAATFAMTGTDTDGAFSISGQAATGSFDYSLTPAGLVYGGSNTGIEVTMASPQIPFPDMSFAVAESEGRVAMPITVSEEPQDLGILMRLTGLSISDTIWGMFDPTGVLPRDPATLVVDVTGKGNWLVDVFDPAYAENPPDDIPGDIQEVRINEILLSLLGAELSGDGAFDFDNSSGIPQPSGLLSLTLVGGNGLIDKLVAMGFVPEDQAMGARMMLGLFARPGNGEDTLVSNIEVKPDGSVLANGQRIK